MKLTIHSLIIGIILIFPILSKSDDTTYVKPNELEPGWGLYWINPGTQEIGIPKSMFYGIAVSPDGYWLAFADGNYLKLFDLKSHNLIKISNDGIFPIWSPDSKVLGYGSNINPAACFYDIKSQITDTVKCPVDNPYCPFGSNWAPDGNSYFAFPYSDSSKDSNHLWRTNIDSSRKKGHLIYEKIIQSDTNIFYVPIFSPDNITYHIAELRYKQELYCQGFDIITNFKYNSRRTIKFIPPDTTWFFCSNNTFYPQFYSNEIALGPRADVYAYVTFRSFSDFENLYNPPFDSSAIAARNACGWYRIDTTGKNMVQLVRSWTPPIGGLSITADGETIYYGFLLQDSTSCIMKMNRYGKNKQMVVHFDRPSSVEEPKEIINNPSDIFPNPVTDILYLSGLVNPRVYPGDMNVSKIRIYNLMGIEVLSTPAGNVFVTNDSKSSPLIPLQRGTIDVSGLPAGVYFIHVGDKVEKFVKI